jgi:hypothetical protein
MEQSGKVFYAAELVQHYRVKDANGFEAPSGRGFIGRPPELLERGRGIVDGESDLSLALRRIFYLAT